MQASSSSQPTSPLARSASSTLQNLLRLIANITVDDISGSERCGGGGFGDVYVLTHTAIGKLALKRIRISGNQQEVDSQIRRATREAETWRRLTHRDILPFLDIIERSGCIYLISPFVSNGSIIEFIRRHPDVDRARLIQEAAAGIAYLHRCGVIHGDIKGANILVSDDVRSLLCDFRLAREEQMNTSTAMRGIGTVRWQSPELMSMSTRSFKSDVWAFAMTIYEILSGHFPYHECGPDTAVILAVFILKQRPPKEPTTSPTGAPYALLWEVAEDCWHHDPGQRLEMQEVYDRLILGSFSSLVLSPPPGSGDVTPNDTQKASSPTPSPPPSPSEASRSTRPSPDTATQSQPLADSGPVENNTSAEEAVTTTVGGQGRAVESQAGLAVSIPPGGGSNTTNDVQITSSSELSSSPSPSDTPQPIRVSPGTVDYDPFRAGSGPVNRQEGAARVTITSTARTIKPRTIPIQHSNNPVTASVRPYKLPKDGVLGRHGRSVLSVGFSPDGKTIASGSWDHTLLLWDVEGGCQRGNPLKGHVNTVTCLAFSPDGTTIVSGSDDTTLRFWDVEAGTQKGEPLKGHNCPVSCLEFSPDGSIVASGSDASAIRLWDVEVRSRESSLMRSEMMTVSCLAFSLDGTTLASGARDGTILLWDMRARRQRGAPLTGHTNRVSSLAFSPNGTTLISGSHDGSIRLWDVKTKTQRGQLSTIHMNVIQCLALSPDGTVIATGCNYIILLWDIEAGCQRDMPLRGHTDEVRCLSFSPDGRTIVSGGRDGIIRLWEV